MRAVLLVAAGLGAASPAFAQADACKDFRWSVAREQAAFAGDGLPTVASGSALPDAGHAATLSLLGQDGVAFPVAVGHKPKHATPHAGVFAVPAVAAGTYQVTLSADAWVEVAQDGKLLKQKGFTGSPTCPTVHKSVRFDLASGPATLEISDAERDAVKVSILPKE